MNAKMLLKISPLAFALGLAAVPGWAQVQVVVGGANETDDDVIQGTALDTLAVDKTVAIPDTGSVWHCVATCSAEIAGPGGGITDDDGRLVIAVDGVEVPGTDRRFELNDNADINDPSPIVVATTGIKNVAAGDHTIACAAAKVAAADADFTVNDSSLTYVCADVATLR